MRYAPARAFPSYAFLPGRDPHPTRDPAGHSFGKEEDRPRPLPPARWRDSVPYLFGVDLYNHDFLWEAHEAWEGLWHVSKPDRLQAQFLQGLIQCAAAWLKIAMDQPRGQERLAALALEKLEGVSAAAGPRYMGLDVARFARDVRRFAAARPSTPAGRPLIVLED